MSIHSETRKYEVVVVGGGLAGVCAAIASARKGARTAIVAFRAKCKMFSRHLQKPILKTEKGRFKGL